MHDAAQQEILMHNDTVCNRKLSTKIKTIYKTTLGLAIASVTFFSNRCTLSQTYSLSNSPQVLPSTDARIRLCAPQGLSRYSISKGRLNPPLVPVCVLSARAPNGPEGAAPRPKMSIIYRVCEQDFISQPNTSYSETQSPSQPATFVWLKQS